MVNESLAEIGHALIWIAAVVGFLTLYVIPNPTVEMLKKAITLMGTITILGGIALLRSQRETKKQKVYILGETPSSKS
ncbi:hypothetical protein KKB43_03790 [Patescibacteria group bacterium]|nr:hypothetical protein [Patescibacteria group bacterium]MBU4580111.1 hypothetical protein [Patescibacteria group bacterium]